MFEYPGFPIERLLRQRQDNDTVELTQAARRCLGEGEDFALLAAPEGARLLGANEDVLQRCTTELVSVFGKDLHVGEPRVRYLPGDVLSEPVMHVRLRVQWAALDEVREELKRREAGLAEVWELPLLVGPPREAVVRASAPLVRLIGLQHTLDEITDGRADAIIALSHYAPIPGEPGAGQPPST